MSDLDLLRNLGDRIVPPPFAALRATAEARARRTAARTGLAAAAAVVAVGGVTWLLVRDDDSAPEPAPTPGDTSHPLTYALGRTIHYGDQTVDAPSDVVELDVTDDGVIARLGDGGIWFTDGTDLSQLGDVGEPGRVYLNRGSGSVGDHPYNATGGLVVSGNTGSRAAWFEFPQPGTPEVVVYDTATGEETARQPVDPNGSRALLHSVTQDYAYLFLDPVFEDAEPTWRLDLGTGALTRIKPEEYYADAPPLDTPRTMMVSHAEGDEPVLFRPHDAIMWQFNIDGRGRVEPQGAQPLEARDGGTGRRFRFTAPDEYRGAIPTWLVQWLDDDTVVLVVTRSGEDDLLECRISTGACTPAVRLPERAVLPEIDG